MAISVNITDNLEKHSKRFVDDFRYALVVAAFAVVTVVAAVVAKVV